MDFSIRPFRTGDTDRLAEAFARWPKPRELFLRYAGEVSDGRIELVVGELGAEVVGLPDPPVGVVLPTLPRR